MKKILGLAIAAALLVACKDDKSTPETRGNGYTHDLKTQEDSLMQEVMDGHDVGMAKTGKIRGAMKTINASIDSLKKAPTPDATKLAVMESIAADLKQADYSMDRWMTEFSHDSAENNKPVRIAYLQSQRDMINTIRDRILGSLKRVDSLYAK